VVRMAKDNEVTSVLGVGTLLPKWTSCKLRYLFQGKQQKEVCHQYQLPQMQRV
jgi:hypothetical protein